MNKPISVDEALSGKKTFYAKKWQQNGYYPINKFVYHSDKDAFEQFVQKSGGWYSWGINDTDTISNKDWWKYIFEHNGYKLSFEEMKDNKNYNYE